MAKNEAVKNEGTAPEAVDDKKVSATAKIKDEGGNVVEEVTEEVNYDFGSNLDEAVQKFGAEVVFTNFKQSATIALQGRMRAHISQGARGTDLQAKVDEWKPGVKSMTRKSPSDKVKDLLSGKSPEEIAKILQEAGIAG